MIHPHPGPAIAATGLRKSFGGHVVLDGLDLNVPPATVFALLGANGAGKTTTVGILSTLLSADAVPPRRRGFLR
jgi:ABC-2 type transport system ATP-binding protein